MIRKLKTLGATLALALCGVALAQGSYPSQPIKWIVPYPAGGGTDAMARQLSQAMQPLLGQPLLVDNRPGASTNIGVAALLQAKPDGHTILQAENAALLFNEHMFAKLPYNPATDFSYIGAIGRIPILLVVREDFQARNLAELVAFVKASGGKASYASAGVGSPHHMAMELFKQKAGLDITHVAYKGAAPAIQDLLGGQVPMMMLDAAAGRPHLESGKVRALAVALPQRAKNLPQVPTFAELGHPEVNAFAYQGLVGPAHMPAEAIRRINADLQRALQSPEILKAFETMGVEPAPGTPEDFRNTARALSAHWGKVIRTSGVRLD
ncbi:tripartite tricarboxylate transporter substrate binding protein [Xenophilus arseniciresistens]|uniref:Tripartite tricarboxylate transporter substrate binding protein n=1 Tax=Xenophilus arseniciresistens TaxID=1283306 RepID=A0AAE3SYQ4_9BURK|nr:tripartite tricarboxylate transporter substrate binding protein [Xenophilus arseniciresistens]MDA7416284.1 tripartite tricarboxylate transporter substrate binding protein [Xenophilus arseniciresistens]